MLASHLQATEISGRPPVLCHTLVLSKASALPYIGLQGRFFSGASDTHAHLHAASMAHHKSHSSQAAGSEELSREETRATTSQEYYNFPHAQTMASFPSAAHDAFSFSDLLTEEEQRIRLVTRDFMVRVTHTRQVCSCAWQLAVP